MRFITILSDSWVKNISMIEKRAYPGMVKMSDEEVWILGGFDLERGGRRRASKTTELCSPKYGCKKYVDLPTSMIDFHQTIRVNETHVFVLLNEAGNCWLFDQIQQSFHPLPDPKISRDGLDIGFINGHEVVLVSVF